MGVKAKAHSGKARVKAAVCKVKDSGFKAEAKNFVKCFILHVTTSAGEIKMFYLLKIFASNLAKNSRTENIRQYS